MPREALWTRSYKFSISKDYKSIQNIIFIINYHIADMSCIFGSIYQSTEQSLKSFNFVCVNFT
jgi:hypothetical protein